MLINFKTNERKIIKLILKIDTSVESVLRYGSTTRHVNTNIVNILQYYYTTYRPTSCRYRVLLQRGFPTTMRDKTDSRDRRKTVACNTDDSRVYATAVPTLFSWCLRRIVQVAIYRQLLSYSFLLRPGRGAEYCGQFNCLSTCMCLSVCLSVSLEPLDRALRNFVCRIPMDVARSSSGGIAICYVLSVYR